MAEPQIPQSILDRLERLEAFEQSAKETGSLRTMRENEERQLKQIREANIFAGMGKPVLKPYTHQPYPSVRYKAVKGGGIETRTVQNESDDQDALAQGFVLDARGK